jgi:aryl-alcohol dehydrogenase-like predicted oxidoreductase
VQSEYSPMVRNPEVAVIDTCRALGIGFVAFSPVARGLLAGAIADGDYEASDLRRTMPRFVGDNLRHNLTLAAEFAALATGLGITSAQLAIAWVLAKGDHIVPIPGTRSIAHLEEDLGAAGVALSADLIAAVDQLFEGRVRGARYARAAQATVDTELLPGEELADA